MGHSSESRVERRARRYASPSAGASPAPHTDWLAPAGDGSLLQNPESSAILLKCSLVFHDAAVKTRRSPGGLLRRDAAAVMMTATRQVVSAALCRPHAEACFAKRGAESVTVTPHQRLRFPSGRDRGSETGGLRSQCAAPLQWTRRIKRQAMKCLPRTLAPRDIRRAGGGRARCTPDAMWIAPAVAIPAQ
jgi:hypothetical protein